MSNQIAIEALPEADEADRYAIAKVVVDGFLSTNLDDKKGFNTFIKFIRENQFRWNAIDAK